MELFIVEISTIRNKKYFVRNLTNFIVKLTGDRKKSECARIEIQLSWIGAHFSVLVVKYSNKADIKWILLALYYPVVANIREMSIIFDDALNNCIAVHLIKKYLLNGFVSLSCFFSLLRVSIHHSSRFVALALYEMNAKKAVIG